jgi:hypothetical protein
MSFLVGSIIATHCGCGTTGYYPDYHRKTADKREIALVVDILVTEDERGQEDVVDVQRNELLARSVAGTLRNALVDKGYQVSQDVVLSMGGLASEESLGVAWNNEKLVFSSGESAGETNSLLTLPHFFSTDLMEDEQTRLEQLYQKLRKHEFPALGRPPPIYYPETVNCHFGENQIVVIGFFYYRDIMTSKHVLANTVVNSALAALTYGTVGGWSADPVVAAIYTLDPADGSILMSFKYSEEGSLFYKPKEDSWEKLPEIMARTIPAPK